MDQPKHFHTVCPCSGPGIAVTHPISCNAFLGYLRQHPREYAELVKERPKGPWQYPCPRHDEKSGRRSL